MDPIELINSSSFLSMKTGGQICTNLVKRILKDRNVYENRSVWGINIWGTKMFVRPHFYHLFNM
jgi:hypothetical protein